MTSRFRPFPNKHNAAYWGGGLLVQASEGGWWSIHWQTTPAGLEKYHVGQDGRKRGWPTDLIDEAGNPCRVWWYRGEVALVYPD